MNVNMDEYDAKRLFPGLISFDIMPGVDKVAILRFNGFYLKIYSDSGSYLVEGYMNRGRQQLFKDTVPLQDMRKYGEQFRYGNPYAGHIWLGSKNKFNSTSLDSDMYPRI